MRIGAGQYNRDQMGRSEAQRRWVGILQKDAALVADPEARAEVEKLLAVARKHLDELEKLTASHPKAGAH